MRRPIKAHLVNRSNRPVNRSNRPVYRYEPVELSFLNSNLNLTGFYRSNRSSLPEPECSGLGLPVGKKTLVVTRKGRHGQGEGLEDATSRGVSICSRGKNNAPVHAFQNL